MNQMCLSLDFDVILYYLNLNENYTNFAKDINTGTCTRKTHTYIYHLNFNTSTFRNPR